MTLFDQALAFVLRWEGGYSNHPSDPGGATNKGITQRVYDSWRDGQSLPRRSVRSLDDLEVRAIYEQRYWLKAGCHRLRPLLAFALLDFAVNAGPSRAVKALQIVLAVEPDGVVGPETVRAAESAPEPWVRLNRDRRAFYRRLAQSRPTLGVFLRGWLNRVDALDVALAGWGPPTPTTEASPVPWLTRQAWAAMPAWERALHYASAQRDVREVSTNWGPGVSRFLAEVGITRPAAWCASFVYSCCRRAGMPAADLPERRAAAAVRRWAEWSKAARRATWEPRRGRLFYWRNSDGSGHIGFVRGMDGSRILTIEGNAGPSSDQGVHLLERPLGDLQARYAHGFIDLGGIG